MNNEFHVNIVLISSGRATYELLKTGFCAEARGRSGEARSRASDLKPGESSLPWL